MNDLLNITVDFKSGTVTYTLCNTNTGKSVYRNYPIDKVNLSKLVSRIIDRKSRNNKI